MADVVMPKSVPCKFNAKGWAPCKKPSDNGFCSEHENLKCVCCAKQALRSCDAQMGGLACGAPLCETCQHSTEGGRIHVTKQVFDDQMSEEREYARTRKESKRMLASRGVPTDIEFPRHLKELLDSGKREDFNLMRCYYLRIKHGLMGEFPVITKNNRIVVITPDKDSMSQIWKSLAPKESEVVTAECIVNTAIGVGYFMREDKFEQELSKPYKIFSKEEIQVLFAKDTQPFQWAPGLLGAGISQQRFEELIQKELVA